MKTIFIFCMLIMTNFSFAMPQDSIGTKTVDGRRYILHKVTKGEGVYGISLKYGVSSADIFASNEGSEKTIKIDQILLIPKGSSGTKTAKINTVSSSSTVKTLKVYHTVMSGQTLSGIAKLYKTTVANIKELNNLKSDNIQLGQKLEIGVKNSSVATVNTEKPKKEPVKTETEKKLVETPVKVEKADPTILKNVVVNTDQIKDKPLPEQSGTINTSYSTDDGDEVTENGIAMISSEGDLSQERSFILHPTAKIGTIVMITNPLNNNAVFARVIGNCKVENGCVLKMSKTVALKLGVSENIEVKLSYAK